MFKKLIIAITILSAVSLTPQAVYAQENCVQVYGGGVVCGAETEKIVHKTVDTDLGDYNPLVYGVILLGASLSLFIYSKRVARRTSDIAN